MIEQEPLFPIDDVGADDGPDVRRGDVFRLGDHRLMCGDSTEREDVAALFGDGRPTMILTDPPYSSGGFQEAGRSRGSKGTQVDYPPIAGDILSTRGYKRLIRSAVALGAWARVAYVFTDWRMWSELGDTMESLGYGVRGMVVWDKGSIGMGNGWRRQHELIMTCTRGGYVWERGAYHGDVVQVNRVPNREHPTQKPVELLQRIIRVTSRERLIYDPFAGMGSGLLAAHVEGRQWFGMEIDPLYVGRTIGLWEKMTGLEAERL